MKMETYKQQQQKKQGPNNLISGYLFKQTQNTTSQGNVHLYVHCSIQTKVRKRISGTEGSFRVRKIFVHHFYNSVICGKFIELWCHHHNPVLHHFHHTSFPPQTPFRLFSLKSHSLLLPDPNDHRSACLNKNAFSGHFIYSELYCVVFCAWFSSFIKFFKFIYVVQCLCILFLFIVKLLN